MSRTTAQSNVHLLESRVLSTDATTHIALDEPAAEVAAIAEEADIEVSATDRADEAEEGECVEAPSDTLAITLRRGPAPDLERTGRVARTIMIMAGGTGGHVFPALAVADYLRARGWRVVWLGARTGMEATLVPQHGYELASVRFSGLRGKGLARQAPAAAQPARRVLAVAARDPRAPAGRRARHGRLHRLPRRHDGGAPRPAARDPRAELGRRASPTGCSPASPTASWSRFPGALREADVRPATRCARRSPRVAPPARALRRARRTAARAGRGREPRRRGAERASCRRRSRCCPPATRPRVVHQSGAKHLDALARGLRARRRRRGAASPFIDDMAQAYAEADVVICRAGAITVAELAAAGVAIDPGAVPVRRGRPPDDQRALPRRRRRGDPRPAARAHGGAARRDRCAGSRASGCSRWRSKARALGKPDATRASPRRAWSSRGEAQGQAHSFRRHRRLRHERHRRGARQPGLPGERLGPRSEQRDRAAGEAGGEGRDRPRRRARRRRGCGRGVDRGEARQPGGRRRARRAASRSCRAR